MYEVQYMYKLLQEIIGQEEVIMSAHEEEEDLIVMAEEDLIVMAATVVGTPQSQSRGTTSRLSDAGRSLMKPKIF